MDELPQRVADLEAQIQGLRGAVSNVILLASSAAQLAQSLAATHPNPSEVLAVFKGVAGVMEGHVTYSQATDAQVAEQNRVSAEVIAFLEKLAAPPPDTPTTAPPG